MILCLFGTPGQTGPGLGWNKLKISVGHATEDLVLTGVPVPGSSLQGDFASVSGCPGVYGNDQIGKKPRLYALGGLGFWHPDSTSGCVCSPLKAREPMKARS